jgi:glutamate dehydrogenase (NAD(P)+)
MSAGPSQELHLFDRQTGSVGWLVMHEAKGGLAVGGLRYSPDASLAETRQLAQAMTRKFRVHGFPIGGAKCSIRPAPGLDATQRRDLLRRMARRLEGPMTCAWVSGTDVGTTAADLADMFAQLGVSQSVAVKRILQRQGWNHPLTWVPDWVFRLIGDRYGNDLDLFTGEGLWVTARTGLELQGLEPGDVRTAVQGIGSVGAGVLRSLLREGITVTRVADASGCVMNDQGLDLEALLEATSPEGLLDREAFAQGASFETLDREAWCTGPTELLLPSAVAGAIHTGNRDALQARVVAEGANLAMDPETDDALHARGILVAPDFIASSGVSCSFGLMLTRQVQLTSEAALQRGTWAKMESTLRDCHARAEERGLSVRGALLAEWNEA